MRFCFSSFFGVSHVFLSSRNTGCVADQTEEVVELLGNNMSWFWGSSSKNHDDDDDDDDEDYDDEDYDDEDYDDEEYDDDYDSEEEEEEAGEEAEKVDTDDGDHGEKNNVDVTSKVAGDDDDGNNNAEEEDLEDVDINGTVNEPLATTTITDAGKQSVPTDMPGLAPHEKMLSFSAKDATSASPEDGNDATLAIPEDAAASATVVSTTSDPPVHNDVLEEAADETNGSSTKRQQVGDVSDDTELGKGQNPVASELKENGTAAHLVNTLTNRSDKQQVNPQEQEHDNEEEEELEEQEVEEGEPGELVLQGAIPEEVVQLRDRANSALTQDVDDTEASEDMLDDEEDDGETTDEDDDNDEEDCATSMEDKQSLLLLAAEHDRVDILNTLLAECSNSSTHGAGGSGSSNGGNGGGEMEGEENTTSATTTATTTKEELLQGALPPLHVAILYGSMNAINCLLRVGADPSIRPNISELPPEMVKSVRNAKQLNGVTAWELVFGSPTDNGSNNKRRNGVKLPPAKIEAIQHAFAAEALRCIGSDEVERLQHLLDAGVPSTLDIGGKTLVEWTGEMGAKRCLQLLRPSPEPNAVQEKEEDSSSNNDNSTA